MATIFEPHVTGLSVYVIFNCGKEFGWAFSVLREKDCVNIGIAKDYGGKEPAGRFNWDEVIPIFVSDYPLILASGKSLVDENPNAKPVDSIFSRQELDEVINFIKRNQQVIKQHWVGEIDGLELQRNLK